MESNDSPEIPGRAETSDIPGLPSGVRTQISEANERICIYADSHRYLRPPSEREQ